MTFLTGTKLKIMNPTFYNQFDSTKSKHSRNAKPDGKDVVKKQGGDKFDKTYSASNVKMVLPEAGNNGGFKF